LSQNTETLKLCQLHKQIKKGTAMSSYVVVESNVLDADKMAQYSQLAAQTLAKFGGKFITKGSAQLLHGTLTFANKAVIEFASEQQAHNWYYSEEYQALSELRNQAMESQFQLVAATQQTVSTAGK
jgi:uncharacterized protein (DUF1330 family)